MPPTERSQLPLFQLATQYYASGRFAALSGILPVSGNLLHHAIEMYLKGALAPALELEAMRKLRHNLQQIWMRAKQTFPGSNLSRFDTAIDRLDPFERLRYPDTVLQEGAQMRITRLRSEWIPATANPGRTEPVYDLVLEDVDELVKVIFSVANLNPAFFSSGLNPRALAVLSEANPHAIFGA
jgi:hypothetical protein